MFFAPRPRPAELVRGGPGTRRRRAHGPARGGRGRAPPAGGRGHRAQRKGACVEPAGRRPAAAGARRSTRASATLDDAGRRGARAAAATRASSWTAPPAQTRSGTTSAAARGRRGGDRQQGRLRGHAGVVPALEAAARDGARFYHETTVGAALPVLGTRARPRRRPATRSSRWTACSREALAYVFDRVMEGVPFSHAVAEAQRARLHRARPARRPGRAGRRAQAARSSLARRGSSWSRRRWTSSPCCSRRSGPDWLRMQFWTQAARAGREPSRSAGARRRPRACVSSILARLHGQPGGRAPGAVGSRAPLLEPARHGEPRGHPLEPVPGRPAGGARAGCRPRGHLRRACSRTCCARARRRRRCRCSARARLAGLGSHERSLADGPPEHLPFLVPARRPVDDDVAGGAVPRGRHRAHRRPRVQPRGARRRVSRSRSWSNRRSSC